LKKKLPRLLIISLFGPGPKYDPQG
jgi:hypothetical protein